MELTYGSYLKLDSLLDLQEPRSDPPEHDELLFIVIHQVYELWFKLLLHESAKLCRDLSAGSVYGAVATLKRARTVMKTLVSQLDILETMTPMSFSSFRDRLETASGFQSAQFRELEFVLGHKRRAAMEHYPEGSPERVALERRITARSIPDHFYDFLERQGAAVPLRLKQRAPDEPHVSDPDVQHEMLRLYRERPDVGIVLELMTDLDEGLQEWRYRHVKMVERTIGNKTGTGGSSGVEFLKATLFRPVFPDLWAIRHEL